VIVDGNGCGVSNQHLLPTCDGPDAPRLGRATGAELKAAYLDTPQRDLHRRGITLRRRTGGGDGGWHLGGHQDTVVARLRLRELGAKAFLEGENAFTLGVPYGMERLRAELSERALETALEDLPRPRAAA